MNGKDRGGKEQQTLNFQAFHPWRDGIFHGKSGIFEASARKEVIKNNPQPKLRCLSPPKKIHFWLKENIPKFFAGLDFYGIKTLGMIPPLQRG